VKQYSSFGAFARHLEKLAVTAPEVTHLMVKAGTEEIKDVAQGEIGFYQTDIAPYPDWAPLADSTEAEKARLGYEPDAPLLRTGDMRASIKSEAEGNEAVVGSNDEKLKYHEFGTDKMPPRPVLGPAAHYSTPRILSRMATTTLYWLSGRGWRNQLRRK
jgi:HK97 gp10 family phage protein